MHGDTPRYSDEESPVNYRLSLSRPVPGGLARGQASDPEHLPRAHSSAPAGLPELGQAPAGSSWTLGRRLDWTWIWNPNFRTGRGTRRRWRLEARLRQLRPRLRDYLARGRPDGPYREASHWTGLEEWLRWGYLRRNCWTLAVKLLEQWEYVTAWLIEASRVVGTPSLMRVVRRFRRIRWLRRFARWQARPPNTVGA